MESNKFSVRLVVNIDCNDEDHTIEINGTSVFDAASPCAPEDACFGRGLVGGDEVIRLMKKAYKAGKEGKVWKYKKKVNDERFN